MWSSLWRLACIAGVVVLGAVPARPQPSAFEGKTIVGVEFPNGQPLDPADLVRVQPLKTGQPLRLQDVAHAIDGLFGTGRFDDIIVEAVPSGNGVIVRFVTKNAWFFGGLAVQGKLIHSPNRAQVVSAGRFSLGEPFQDDQVQMAVNSIQRLLQSNGFYEAKIESSVQRDPASQLVFLTFQVHGGNRAKYEEPSITGMTKLSDPTIVRATGWQLPIVHWWRHVTSTLTRRGVERISNKYASKGRLLARVDLKKMEYDEPHRRVRADLDIDAGPKVKITSIETKVSNRVLKKYVPVYQQHTVDEDLLTAGARNLRDYFQSQGYYDATVDFRQLPVTDDLETIEYVVSRGSRYKLVNVKITGNRYFDTDSIEDRMFMAPAGFLINRHGRYSEAFRRKDEENIANLYRANGFRDVKVTSSVSAAAKGKSSNISVTVTIDEGGQWVVDQFAIHGMNAFKPSDLPALASSVGQPFSEVNLASDRDTLLTYYYTHGFPKAVFQAAWRQISAGHVSVVYTITEGDREFVRNVLISGLEHTHRSLVDQQVTMKPGEPLSPVEETNIQKALYDLGVFANVQTAVENPDGDTTYKNVLYHFEEADRYTISIGFGAQLARFGTPNTSTLAGAGGTTGFSPEGSLTVSRLNFLGIGHTVTLRGAYSSIQKLGSLTYLQPRVGGSIGRDLTYALLYDNELDIRTFASRREEASVQLSQKFTKALSGLFQFAYRDVSVSNVIIPVLLVPQFVQPVRIGMLSANFVQDRRDNPGNPRHGMYNTVSFGLSSSAFGSQRSFARGLFRNATYYPLGKTWILARQTQFGMIVPFATPKGIGSEQSVPLPERFYAGGADSLRAFPYNEAGPRDTGAPLVPGGPSSQPTGFPLGGNALFINNTELRFPFIGQNVQGVLFHDMGNVYSSLGDISFRVHQKNLQDFNYMVHDVGFGVRYKTPVGPIRVDLAYTINPPKFIGFSGTPAQLLNCNPNLPPSQLPGYCTPSQQGISHFQFFFSIGQTF